MKRIIITTLACFCMALAVLSGIPTSGATISSHAASRNKSCTVSPDSKTEMTGQRSLHQYIRERKFSPNDNRLTDRAPQRLSPEEITGSRIVVMEAQGVEDFDTNGYPIMSDIVYSLGWGNDVFSWANGAYDNDSLKYYGINGFYGKYQLPFEWNEETGEPMLYSNILVYEDTINGYFNFNSKVDTVRTVIFYTMSDFFEDGNGEELPGTVLDDGTILFEGSYLIYTEEVYLKYHRIPITGTVTLISKDSAAYITPILSYIYLLSPNGIHEFNDMTPSSSGNPYFVRMDDIQSQSLYYGEAFNQGDSGHHPFEDIVGGSGGLVPKPIKPGRPGFISPIPITPVGPFNPSNTESSTPSYFDISSNTDSSSSSENEMRLSRSGKDGSSVINFSGGHKPKPIGGGGHFNKPIVLPRTVQDPIKIAASVGSSTTMPKSASQKPKPKKMITEIVDAGMKVNVSLNSIASQLFGNTKKLNRPRVFDKDVINGGGGRQPKPIRLRDFLIPTLVESYSPNSSLYKTSNGLYQAPVYMFQYDDSTVIVYNLFGLGSTFNAIFINEDGTMSLPGQALFYDPDLNDDFCNYSLVNDTLMLGNTGLAAPDGMTWDVTVPHGLDNSYPGYFDNNRLYFTDGNQFILPVAFLRGDVNRDRKVSIADVTSLINSLLTEVYDNSAHFSTEAADVNQDGKFSIGDVTTLINYLLSGSWGPD